MANPDHLELLLEAVAEWNSNRPAKPDLNGANLRGADLGGAVLDGADLRFSDLRGAQLGGANLRAADLGRGNLGSANLAGADIRGADLGGADLREANLQDADLADVDLSAADLSGANLIGADLGVADLRGADLSWADIRGANLRRANLTDANLADADLRIANLSEANLRRANLRFAAVAGTDLAGAQVHGTSWGSLDLRGVIGLGEIHHAGPSTVGIDTIYRSNGQIPPEFLRGCGVPDYLISLIPGLTATGVIQHHAGFISYNHDDSHFADQLYRYLFHDRKIPVWQDKYEVRGGQNIMVEVDRAIGVSDRVVLVLSEASLNSWWIDQEIARWVKKERELRNQGHPNASMMIPVDLDGHIHDSDHPYAATILEKQILPAQGWEVDDGARVFAQIERALKRDDVSPFDLLREAGDANID